MLNETKLKLTALYLLIIMAITIAFSIVVYSTVNYATRKTFEAHRLKFEKQFDDLPENLQRILILKPFNDEAIDEIAHRTVGDLVIINLIIFFTSGTLGYYLAGRTLTPIEEMMKKQNRFISDAAHELKTPLAAMKVDLEVTLRDPNLSIETAKESLNNTIDEINTMTQITNNLLNACKYKNELENLSFKKISLNELIQKEITRLTNKANEKNISFETTLGPSFVDGDEIHLQNAFRNILDNAIKYSPAETKITVKTFIKNKCITTEIKDQGIGINPNDIKHIFEPFFRADESRSKTLHDSYGLGLTITKEIIDAHNGKIKVQSQKDKGTTFMIELPESRKN